MPHVIAIEYSESQRRQLKDELSRLTKAGWPLSAKYDAETFGTWQKLFETAITPGLFAERESIVIENAEILGDFPDSLASLVEPDTADTVIILVMNGDSKFLKSVAKSITLIKPEAQIPPWKRQAWLVSVAKEQGFKLSQDAASLLADSIESQEELRSEIIKLGIFADGREITAADVQSLSFDEGGRAMMMFVDGVCANNPNDVARAINHLRGDSVLPIIAAITNRLRPAVIISLFQGKYTDEALKAAGFDPVSKKYAIGKAKSALKNYGAERIKIFMAESARLSFLEKTSLAEGWQGFEAAVWGLMAKVHG
ncbi:MAG: hypothetical protein II877_10150 [Synergistaceae bacterium]|nr:hypothetical protein [Synergistaceae bacterium]MBQ7170207.1 hypothetical protein [Synergistaceae bacterium]